MSQVTKTFTEHPQNSMILMNGAVLECLPKESNQGDFVPDQMKLDTTGVYLSIGNKPHVSYNQVPLKKRNDRRNSSRTTLFICWHTKSVSCVTVGCFLLPLPCKMDLLM